MQIERRELLMVLTVYLTQALFCCYLLNANDSRHIDMYVFIFSTLLGTRR